MTRLRRYPELLDDLHGAYGIRRVPRRTVVIPHWRRVAGRLVWRHAQTGASHAASDWLAREQADADLRRRDDNVAGFAALLAVERATDLGVLRTGDGGHFRYPARAWREVRPIVAWLCLVGGLLLSLAGLVAGTALVFAGVVWLIGGGA